MKNIKIIIIIIGLCYSTQIRSQITHSTTIFDTNVSFKKIGISTLLGAEILLKKRQARLIQDLRKEEKEYGDKRSSFTSIPVIATVFGIIRTLDNKISEIEHKIRLRKSVSFGIHHGLSRHEAQLQRETAYFKKLRSEYYKLLSAKAVGSGGGGHDYTAFLKLLIRIMNVRAKIFEIDKEVKGLEKASELLSR